MTALTALHQRVTDTIGAKLFTVSAVDLQTEIETRIYSSNATTYPTGAQSHICWDVWAKTLYRDHQPYIANRVTDQPDIFSDYAQINALGCNACLNVPIVAQGRVIAMMNLLHQADWFTPARVDAAMALAPLAANVLANKDAKL